MKKITAFITAVILSSVLLFGLQSSAAEVETINYYDSNGNQITIDGMYYNSSGHPMFNADCYYLNADGVREYVGGCRVYYRDDEGNLTEGMYYYDTNGNIADCPRSFPGDLGCGSYYYNSQGHVQTGTFYYDSSGNRVAAPVVTGGHRQSHRRHH